jgi:hypothetical protein
LRGREWSWNDETSTARKENPMSRLQGSRRLITGGATGIGLETRAARLMSL